MRNRRKGGLPAPAPAPASHAPASLAAHADSFLAHLAARAYSQGSIDAHRWALRQFTAWTDARAAHDPATFIRADMEAYQLFLHQYRSPRGGLALVVNTQLARLGCVRRFFAWLCRSGVIPANPAADLDLPRKQARHLPKLLSEQEIQLLLAIPNTADPFGLRDRAILELFYATGIRRTEMTNLDHGDYDPTTRTLLVRKGKGGKSRMLPVGERAAAWLDRFLTESRPLFHHQPSESALFLSGYGERFSPAYLGNWIKTLMKRCGINKTGSCHLWRHSCATDMHRGGADIRYVQEMLGHARMETTQIYTHVHIDALREVHARCHPHGTLGPDRDMHGKLTPPENQEEDFTSPTPTDPLTALSNMNAVANPTLHHACAAEEPWRQHPQDPPEDDPTAGVAPKSPPPAPSPQTGQNACNSLVFNPFSKEGRRTETGCVADYQYRYYDPLTGRWPSRDPLGDEMFFQGQMQNLSKSLSENRLKEEEIRLRSQTYGSLYEFVNNDGINSWDKLGLFMGFSYGNWCGYATRGPGAPIDKVDEACQAHDKCLATWADTVKLKCCNGKFLVAVAKASCKSSPDPAACRKAKAIILGPGSLIGGPLFFM